MDKYTQLSPEMQEAIKNKMKEFNAQLFTLYEKQNEDAVPIGSVEFSLSHFAEEYDNQLKELYSSTDSRISTLKSQLKHCKNYLERQNIERELNRLYKERR